MQERHQPSGPDRDEEAEPPGAKLVGPEDAEERAHQHHSFETDVRDAGALAEHASQGREDERGCIAEHGGEERRPDDHCLEFADARERRQES